MKKIVKQIITIIEKKNIKIEQHARDHATCERNDVKEVCKMIIHLEVGSMKVTMLILLIIIFIDNFK